MSISPSDLHGKLVALLVWETHEGSEEAAVFFGVAKYDGAQLILDRGEDGSPFLVEDDWLSRIQPVPEGTDEIFQGADYYLQLSIEALPEGIDPTAAGYVNTGLVWPDAKS